MRRERKWLLHAEEDVTGTTKVGLKGLSPGILFLVLEDNTPTSEVTSKVPTMVEYLSFEDKFSGEREPITCKVASSARYLVAVYIGAVEYWSGSDVLPTILLLLLVIYRYSTLLGSGWHALCRVLRAVRTSRY